MAFNFSSKLNLGKKTAPPLLVVSNKWGAVHHFCRLPLLLLYELPQYDSIFSQILAYSQDFTLAGNAER
ncbi:hypothetical protein FHS15_005681 [Paenibacillus castaneae]|nr:hypothetical protein [Paenibacillus castaneae]